MSYIKLDKNYLIELTKLLKDLDEKRTNIINKNISLKKLSNKKLYNYLILNYNNNNLLSNNEIIEFIKIYEETIIKKEEIKKEFIQNLKKMVKDKDIYNIYRYGQGNILEYIVNIEKIPEGFIGIDFFDEIKYKKDFTNFLKENFNNYNIKNKIINLKNSKENLVQKNNIDTFRIFNNKIIFIDIKGKMKISNVDITLETAGNYDFKTGKIIDEGWLKNPLSDNIVSYRVKKSNKNNKSNNNFLNKFINNEISIDEYKKYINNLDDVYEIFKEYYDISNQYHKFAKKNNQYKLEEKQKIEKMLLYIFNTTIKLYEENKIELEYSAFTTEELKKAKKNIDDNSKKIKNLIKNIVNGGEILKRLRKNNNYSINKKNLEIKFSVYKNDINKIKNQIRTKKILDEINKIKFNEGNSEKINVLKINIKDKIKNIEFNYITIAFLDKNMKKIVYKDRILLGNETYQTSLNGMNTNRNGSSINYNKEQINYINKHFKHFILNLTELEKNYYNNNNNNNK